jgi:hypothetical protein
VVLVDGNRTQIDAVKTEARRRNVDVHIVLDFIHVLEYLWKAAWSFFDKADPDAETWVADQAIKILEGNAGQVAAGIRRRATRFGYSPSERARADEAADYLTTKKAYLAYDHALAHGWPIATGVIEGACRHLVKDRTAPRGALSYPRHSREELGRRFLGLMADLDLKGEGDNSMPGKQRSCSGV